ncbi:MAG: hypothetical protein LBK06_00600 [Planctomycetaceae bacterium]|nr:hypothetical protein [Planctomycetaceae bacterium]
MYAEAVLKVEKLNTQAQQRGAIVQGRSLSPYRLRYKNNREQLHSLFISSLKSLVSFMSLTKTKTEFSV